MPRRGRRLVTVASRPQFRFAAAVLIPSLLWYGLFVVVPTFQTLQISLLDYHLLDPSQNVYVGFKNFTDLFDNPLFPVAVINTVLWTVLAIVVIVPISLALAQCLVIVKRGRETAKVQLSQRFQEAVDRAAMRAGKGSSDAYLADWQRSEAAETSRRVSAIAGDRDLLARAQALSTIEQRHHEVSRYVLFVLALFVCLDLIALAMKLSHLLVTGAVYEEVAQELRERDRLVAHRLRTETEVMKERITADARSALST